MRTQTTSPSPAHQAVGAQISHYLFVTAIASLIMLGSVGCTQDEDKNNSIETMAGAQVGDVAGAQAGTSAGSMSISTAGETAGTTAGEMAGTTAGEMAGTSAGEITMDDTPCQGYCAHLEQCGSCLYDASNMCADQETCVEICLTEVPEVAATCIAGLTTCDEDELTACYDQTIGEDDCAQTCLFLEECEQCFTDESGECLSLAACAATCREVTPPAAASCIAMASECSEIDSCF